MAFYRAGLRLGGEISIFDDCMKQECFATGYTREKNEQIYKLFDNLQVGDIVYIKEGDYHAIKVIAICIITEPEIQEFNIIDENNEEIKCFGFKIKCIKNFSNMELTEELKKSLLLPKYFFDKYSSYQQYFTTFDMENSSMIKRRIVNLMAM